MPTEIKGAADQRDINKINTVSGFKTLVIAALQVPKCRTEFFKESFMPKNIRSWNSITRGGAAGTLCEALQIKAGKASQKHGPDTSIRMSCIKTDKDRLGF